MITANLSISAQGQLTIPKSMREAVGLAKGQKVLLMMQEGPLIVFTLVPKDQSIVELAAGSAEGLYGNIADYIEGERGGWDEAPIE